MTEVALTSLGFMQSGLSRQIARCSHVRTASPETVQRTGYFGRSIMLVILKPS